MTSSSTSTQNFIWCWCVLYSLSSLFIFIFCQDTSHLSSVTRWVPLLSHYTLVDTRCWAKQDACVFLLFFMTFFYMAAVQRRFGMVEDLVQRYHDSEKWFGRLEEEGRCEDDLSDFRNWQVQQHYFGGSSQWRGGPDDRRYGSAWEQRGWFRCVGHSSRRRSWSLDVIGH